MGRPSVKEQLVERTLGVWLTHGFEGASVNDLVAAAGVPKGSFYNHFSSKEDFAVEHVRRYVVGLNLDRLRSADGSALDAIRQHFRDQMAARDAEGIPPACLLGTFSTGVSQSYPDLLAAVRNGFAQWLDAMTEALIRARNAGEIASDHPPAELAAALVDGFQGALGRARVTGNSQPLDTFLSVTLLAVATATRSASEEPIMES
jgi:TetR/AcrR family transcriptional repressor of nem operon